MGERNLDFDTVIERKNTKCIKYDFAVKRGKSENVLPLWVADMDFKVSSYITDALEGMVSHGIFGYSESEESYFKALKGWMKRHHNWDIQEKWLVKTPGVVFALATAVRAFTKEGEGVLIQQPVYYPFAEIIVKNNRKLVDNTLVLTEKGSYAIDYEDFERKIVEENVKLFILCNPHNPVGRVWTKEELIRLGDICLKHNVLVISDEIHSDFIFSGEHRIFANLKREYADISMICTAPSKTFNIAGLQISNIFLPNEALARRFRKELDATGYSQLSLPALIACEAAYQHGDEWLNAVLAYIKKNAQYVQNYLEKYLPKVKMINQEGTYLVWLDFREYKLSDKELDKRIVEQAGLWLDSGAMFGKSGEGFQRINIACPRATLKEALERLRKVF